MVRPLLFITGAASLAFSAISFERSYVSSVNESPFQITLDASSATVISAVKQMTILKFLRGFNSRKELDYILSEEVAKTSGNELKLEARYGGDHVLTIFAKVRPLDASHTICNFTAELPASRLTASDKLSSKDLADAEAIIAFLATNHVARSFGKLPDGGKKAAGEFKTSIGLSDKEIGELMERFGEALAETYVSEMREVIYQITSEEQRGY